MTIIAGLLGAFISLVFAVYSLKIYEKAFNPMFIMDILFGPMILLSLFNFFGFYAVSVDVYIMLALGIAFYNFGCLIPSVNEPIQLSIRKRDTLINHSPSIDKVIIAFDIILLVICVIELINVSYYFINGYSTAYIRGVYFRGSLSLTYGTNELWQVIRTYVKSPLTFVVISVSSIWLIEYRRVKQFIISIIILLMQLIVSFSRFSILYIVIALLISYFVIRYIYPEYGNGFLSSKRKRHIKRLSVVGIMGIIGVSFVRGVESLLKSFYEYYCGCIFLLNQLLDEIPVDKNMGLVSFQGFIAPVYFLAHQILGIPYSDIYINAINVLEIKSAAHVISSSGLKTNAFATMLYPLLCDFGLIGIPLGMTIFGFAAGVFFRKMLRMPSERNIAMYIIVVIAIIKSIQDYPFSTSTLILPILILWFIYRKDQKIINKTY